MVSRQSATSGLCDSQPSLTIQIDENHSDMVKLTKADPRIEIIASKLGNIMEIGNMASQASTAPSAFGSGLGEFIDPVDEPSSNMATLPEQSSDTMTPWDDKSMWDDDSMYNPVCSISLD
jgi:hypothetical protein